MVFWHSLSVAGWIVDNPFSILSLSCVPNGGGGWDNLSASLPPALTLCESNPYDKGYQPRPFPNWVTSNLEIIQGWPGNGSPVTAVASQDPFSGVRNQWVWSEAKTAVRGYSLITQPCPNFSPPQMHSHPGSNRPVRASTEERVLSFKSLDFLESVFPAWANPHSPLSYLHCSKASHRTLPQECKVLRWFSLTSSSQSTAGNPLPSEDFRPCSSVP